MLLLSQKSSCIRFAAVTRYNSPTACRMSHAPSYKRRAETHYNLTSYYELVEQLTINTGILLPWISCSMRVGIY